MIPVGREFYKLTGSGNDFVFVDIRREPAGELERPEVIGEICARGSGIGADGIVFLRRGSVGDIGLRYLNSDGSLAALCGNATLCTARLAAELGIVDVNQEFTIETDSGPVRARFRDGFPEIDLQPVTELQDCFETDLQSGELRIGFALVGVPHLIVRCQDVDAARVVERGRQLRRLPELAHGANINFVSEAAGGWRIRTYERGVEAETLACGTGTVATALLLRAWAKHRKRWLSRVAPAGLCRSATERWGRNGCHRFLAKPELCSSDGSESSRHNGLAVHVENSGGELPRFLHNFPRI